MGLRLMASALALEPKALHKIIFKLKSLPHSADLNSNKNYHKTHEYHTTNIGYRADQTPPV